MDRFIPERYRTEHKAHLHRFGETGTTKPAEGARQVLWASRSNGEEFPIEASISQIDVSGEKLSIKNIQDIRRDRKENSNAT